jgi:hypothetical protein
MMGRDSHGAYGTEIMQQPNVLINCPVAAGRPLYPLAGSGLTGKTVTGSTDGLHQSVVSGVRERHAKAAYVNIDRSLLHVDVGAPYVIE